MLFGQTVRAAAPIQQTTNPAPFSNYYSIVDMTKSATLDVGTGSIIGSHYVTEGNEQIGYFCVLTADHVIAGKRPNSIGFGYFGDGTNGANSFSATYPIVKTARGGSTGQEDLAVAIVKYGVVDPFFVSVQNLKLWTPPADLSLPNLPIFSQVGYGDTGTPHYDSGVQDGFTPQSSSGIQRFTNAHPVSTTANAAHSGYTYTDVKWNPGPVSPGHPDLGVGSSFGGDSGGPYLTTDTTVFTINGLIDVFGTAVGPQMISVFSDTIFAVHTFGNNNNPQLFSDNLPSGGNLLTAADIMWINAACEAVPEPSTWLLACVGLISLLVTARRRRA